MKIFENKEFKILRSENYNYNFNKVNGMFARWGATLEQDPDYSMYGAEILDLEISSGGDCKGDCPFCYKCNGGDQPTYNMTLEEFKIILDKMPKTLTQIAFGIMNIDTNPDFFLMMEYARSKGVIPNYTTHGIDTEPEWVDKTAELCGAVAVSIVDKEETYNTIKKFTDAGMTQVNIHYMLSEETYERALSVVDDIASDERLSKMNAIVFLQYKSKGRYPEAFHSIQSPQKYIDLIEYCNKKGIRFGFDSCSAPLFFKSMEKFYFQSNKDKYMNMVELAEPCESTLFSSYINCKGEFFPCSFSEGSDEWSEGLSVLDCDDFLKDIWHNPRITDFRNRIINSSKGCIGCVNSAHCRSCFLYPDVNSCKNELTKTSIEVAA